MTRRTKMLSLFVIVLVGSIVGFSLFISQAVRETPSISVDGGHILKISSDIATVRSKSMSVNITLLWDTSTGIGIYQINITNINVDRIEMESNAQIQLITTGKSYKLLQVSTTNLTAYVHLFTPNTTENLNFFVFGDSQGYQGGIEQIVDSANVNQPDFIFHCGDITPFSTEIQYKDVINSLTNLTVPIFTTIGNHDIRLGGGKIYLQYFGPSTYSFDIGSAHFTIFNTSAAGAINILEEEIEWLENDISKSQAQWKFVFTHIPPFDPRLSGNHAMANETTAIQLMTIFEENDIDVVFTGHIHMYNQTTRNGVRYVITGGAGASLYETPENGGIYHYINVTVTSSDFIINPILLDEPSIERNTVVVKGLEMDVTLSIEDLACLSIIEGFSSFQNQYENWRGQGTYCGIKISELVELVGGIGENDILRVTANDGFTQDFCYSNVNPNTSWYTIQGDMILAYQHNNSIVPEWSNGMRIIMIPPDGAYSNDDCLATSALDMGCHIYLSAGARCVRYVSRIEVINE